MMLFFVIWQQQWLIVDFPILSVFYLLNVGWSSCSFSNCESRWTASSEFCKIVNKIDNFAHNLTTRGRSSSLAVLRRGVMCNCYFVWCARYLVRLWYVPCICVRYDLKVWLIPTCIRDVTHCLCDMEVDYKFFWEWWLYCCTPSTFARDTLVFHVFPQIHAINYLRTKHSTASEMRDWRTVGIFPGQTSIGPTKCDHLQYEKIHHDVRMISFFCILLLSTKRRHYTGLIAVCSVWVLAATGILL